PRSAASAPRTPCYPSPASPPPPLPPRAIQPPKPAVTPPLFRDIVSPIMAEITAGKQRGRPFRRGESGNSAGRPVGARHKATVAAETLLDGEAEGLTRKVLEMALAGDTVAMRLCLEAHPTATARAAGAVQPAQIAIAIRCGCSNGGDCCRSSRWQPHPERSGRIVEIGGCLREGARCQRFRSAASRDRS